jgi:hypothetical protein
MWMTQSTWMTLSCTKERKDLPLPCAGSGGLVNAAFTGPQMFLAAGEGSDPQEEITGRAGAAV